MSFNLTIEDETELGMKYIGFGSSAVRVRRYAFQIAKRSGR
jgi:hypothetical protein